MEVGSKVDWLEGGKKTQRLKFSNFPPDQMDQRQRGIRSGRADCQRRQGHQVGRQNGQRQTVEGQDVIVVVVIDVVAQGQESKGGGESRVVVGEEEDELAAADAGLQRTRRQG